MFNLLSRIFSYHQLKIINPYLLKPEKLSLKSPIQIEFSKTIHSKFYCLDLKNITNRFLSILVIRIVPILKIPN